MLSTDQLICKVGSPVEREVPLDQTPNPIPKKFRKDEKKSDVGKKRNDENVHVQHACGEGERGDENFVRFKPSLGLGSGGGPKVSKSDIPSHQNTKVGSCFSEGEVRPRTVPEGSRIAGQCLGSAVGTATDLSLLTPRPETSENLLILERALEIDLTESEKRARSSANAKEWMLGNLEM